MDSGGDRCHNQCGSVFITGIVLNDDNRTDAALFRPNYRVQLGAINITTAIYPIFFHHLPDAFLAASYYIANERRPWHMMKENWVYYRGDLYCVKLDPVVGSARGSSRPDIGVQS